MKRPELMRTLKRIEPALGASDMVAATGFLCFDGEYATAYDDRIALVSPCETPFVGGVPGRPLLDILGASTAEEVSFEQEGETLKIKCGRTRLTLPLLAEKDFLFQPEEPDEKNYIIGSDDLLQSMRDSLLSPGVDPSVPTRLGVTLTQQSKGSLEFYCSDDTGLTHSTCAVQIKGKMSKVADFILSMRFLQTLLNITASDPLQSIHLTEGTYVMARFDSGTELYARVLPDANRKQFTEVIDGTMSNLGPSFAVPAGLARTLDRVCLLVGSASTGSVTLALEKDQLVVSAEQRHGSLVERHRIKGENFPACSYQVSPDRLRRALPRTNSIAIGPVLVLTGIEFLHLLATRGE